MNERIRELMKQANPSGDFSDCEWVFEKFAELVVGECIQTLVDNTPRASYKWSAEEDWDRGYDQAMRDCVHHIQEHFGVEE